MLCFHLMLVGMGFNTLVRQSHKLCLVFTPPVTLELSLLPLQLTLLLVQLARRVHSALTLIVSPVTLFRLNPVLISAKTVSQAANKELQEYLLLLSTEQSQQHSSELWAQASKLKVTQSDPIHSHNQRSNQPWRNNLSERSFFPSEKRFQSARGAG